MGQQESKPILYKVVILTDPWRKKYMKSQAQHLLSTCGGKITCGSWNWGKARVTDDKEKKYECWGQKVSQDQRTQTAEVDSKEAGFTFKSINEYEKI